MKNMLLLTLALLACAISAAEPQRPNILYILCDDLGYGDIKALNPQGKIPTPCVDKLAAAGMIFTDAHGASSVCTPTRYGILTGRYNWRSRLQSGVLGGSSPRLIEPGRLTVAQFLKDNGYKTACFGKWHLGMDWPMKAKAAKPGDDVENAGKAKEVDYAQPIANSPVALGFDYYFGISASLDMAPFIFIENDRATAIPTVEKQWVRKGPAAADFEAVDVLPKLTAKTIQYLGEHKKLSDAKGKETPPFFIYMPLNSPHAPIVPSPEWQGKSGLNEYADFVMQTDACVGQVLDALEKNGQTENTLVIFTSDNGCSPVAKIPELEKMGHFPNSHFRGMKADIWDGGHRIPFIARWPGKVKAGSTSEQIVCLNDLMATCAELIGAKLPETAGEDSVSILPALLGTAVAPLREAIVHHSIQGNFAIRQANWKLELCPGSGGWSNPKPGGPAEKDLPKVQLYDMSSDVDEKKNVQAEHPEIVEKLTKLLEKYVADGRSTPGAAQKNTVAVDIWKLKKKAKKNEE